MKFSTSLLSLSIAAFTVVGISATASAQDANSETIKENKVAQLLGGSSQPKRPGDNYIGLGTVIGGDTDVLDAAVISKVKVLNLGRSKSISVRPSAIFSNGDLDVRIPATIDWTRINRDLGEFNNKLTPYAGAGVALDSDGDADLMVTAGVDVNLTPKFTGTAAANVLFLGDTEFDATIGVGYNF